MKNLLVFLVLAITLLGVSMVRANGQSVIIKANDFLLGPFMGDLNADGCPDIMGFTSDSVYVFLGGKKLPSNVNADTCSIMFVGEKTDFIKGLLVGDFNGDGDSDLAIQAPSGTLLVGHVYIFFGPIKNNSGQRKLNQADVIIEGLDHPNRAIREKNFGWKGAVGKVNNDEIDDILISGKESAKLYLFYGRKDWPANMISSEADVSRVIDKDNMLSLAISSSGEVIVGNPSARQTAGDCFVFSGQLDTLLGVIEGPNEKYSLFGNPSLGKGEKIIIGSINTVDNLRQDFSKVYVYNKDFELETMVIAPLVETMMFPVNMVDLNKDGHPDLFLGDLSSKGSLYIIFGPLSGDIDLGVVSPNIRIDGDYSSEGLGLAAEAADFDNDSTMDLAVGGLGNWRGEIKIFYNFLFNYSAVGNGGGEMVTEYSLSQNYPNPFNPTTTIDFTIPQDGQVRIVVLNMLGQKVVSLTNRHYPSGQHSIIWDASHMSSGIYFYCIESRDFNAMRKMVLMK